MIFIFWIAFILFQQKEVWESHKKECKNKYSFSARMPSEETKILEFNQYQESDKAPFNFYTDLECLLENIDRCKNNPENSSSKNVVQHTSSGFSMSTISSFKSTENKHDVYRDKECMKIFCESLRKHAMEIINVFKNLSY